MQNGTMLQCFHWYTPDDGNFWNNIKKNAASFSDMGITAVWLPPAFKADAGQRSVGYDVYDIYDLGEFDQKGSIRTKYGTKEEYIDAINALHQNGVVVYADIVLNHLAGADECEMVHALKVNPDNRLEVVEGVEMIEAFTKFTFPGRKGKYSAFVWDKDCFTGVDYAKNKKESAIFSIVNEYGDGWEDIVDDEKGNYDYLMYTDIEFRNPAVREELKSWSRWYYDTVNFDGVRLDAVKHIPPYFYNEWLDHLRETKNKELFAVAEYWAPHKLDLLLKYIDVTEGRVCLFDAPLQQNFHAASKQGKAFNMADIFQNTLTGTQPLLSVSLVDNHDTQPLQALEAPVEAWFKPLAYALILLRQDGYPCVFYPDLEGAHYTDKGNDGQDHEIFLAPCDKIKELLLLRKDVAYGLQRDYLDHANCIGWTREGIDVMEDSGCAILLSNGDAGNKTMEIGRQHAGKQFIDYLQNHDAVVTINEDGWAEFLCNAGSVSVWVAK